MILLENETIKASFVKKGAELKSLVHKKIKLEYMWDANPNFWAKTSPILFPIVGGLNADTYSYQEKNYTLPRHGFARDMDFELEQISGTEVLFTLKHSAETLAVYPFEFNLGIRYQLTGDVLSCTYEVFNPGSGPLLFSIGGHPAFAVPLMDNEKYNDYYLLFNKDTELHAHKIVKNLIDEQTNHIPLQDGKLVLEYGLFYEDALVFKTMKSDRISILNTKNDHGLHFDFKDFPYFGIWAAKDANFVCLEPWCGITDAVGHESDLEKKEGIINLNPKVLLKRKYEIAIF